MGNYAASGGYYIACGADKIFAEPTTITGSIGVFGMLPNATKLANQMGVRSEVVSTHNNGAHYSAVMPLDNRFKNIVQEGIENIYDQFLDRVAKGRGMTVDEVDAIAQGRVWTGDKAKEIGLVDEIGGLDSAIIYAAEMAKIKDFSIKELPEYDVDFKEVFNINPFAKININKVFSEYNLEWMMNAHELMQSKGIQARIPFEIEIE